MGRKPNDGRGRLGGRAKGTKNKIQPLERSLINQISDETYDMFLERFKNIVDDKQFCDVWLKLLKFSIPELSSVDVSTDTKKSDLRDELEEIYRESKEK